MDEVGQFHIAPDLQKDTLSRLKSLFQIGELAFLSTCNRVEWMLEDIPANFNHAAFLARVYPNVSIDLLQQFQRFEGDTAVLHAMKVACSLESMVVGEREILTQWRGAMDFADAEGFSGEKFRLLNREVVLNAKRIFSETDIATRPVSVVSIAFKEFQEWNQYPADANVVVVGAGQTNTNFLRFLKKNHPGFRYHIFNRTPESAEELANMVSGKWYGLPELEQFAEDIDILVACTGAETPTIDAHVYAHWGKKNMRFPKVIVDLGLPADVDPEVADDTDAHLISMQRLQPISKANMASRHEAINHCKEIIDASMQDYFQNLRNRYLELALKDIPTEMRKYRKRAEEEIFAGDLEKLDGQSREAVKKMLDYLEKKYIGIPYKITKQVFQEENTKKVL